MSIRRRLKRSVWLTRIFLVGLVVMIGTQVRGGIFSQGIFSQGIFSQGIFSQGIFSQGIFSQGIFSQGTLGQGIFSQGIFSQGIFSQGIFSQGIFSQGIFSQGTMSQGLATQGIFSQGIFSQGIFSQGIFSQGIFSQGQGLASDIMQLRGVDRVRAFSSPVVFGAIQRVDIAPLPNIQWLQTGAAYDYSPVSIAGTGVQLKAGPNDLNDGGSFIYAPKSATDPSPLDLTGTLWSLPLSDTCASDTDCTSPSTCTAQGVCSGAQGYIPLYISAVETDELRNSSKYPSNDDVFLYTVYYRQPGTGQWSSLCPADESGKPRAMAIPVNFKDWGPDSSKQVSFACNASGVAAKCARDWGYKPWKTVPEVIRIDANTTATESISFAPFYNACLVAARADYCQDDHSYTKNGTTVDLFDSLDGFSSINATVGLPYEPNSPGLMLAEEYQISTQHVVKDEFCDASGTCNDAYKNMSVDDQALVARLLHSGMESSRYADLDPGRSCAAAPFTDRCDPKEPYACYRAANMASQNYGAFLAVNSPRHCAHDEVTEGPALDPLCNQCVTRVCQIDPTCCGDPGNTFYPGSLVWDQRCMDLRSQVCKSAGDTKLWDTGQVAPVAGSHPVVFLRGAIGSFEGIVTENGVTYAQGWACDPDHPDSSVPVQLSIGGELGKAGAPTTVIADQTLASLWIDDVAAECGGGTRHGFRVPLTAAGGTSVYAYGIDLDTPAAPFTLLRGGVKQVPSGTASAPHGVIWTGWFEPAATGTYTFCRRNPGPTDACFTSTTVNPTGGDWYRIWVNGVYVAGNWKDTATPLPPGAFTLNPPSTSSPPGQYLLQGVRYAVRIEYIKPTAGLTLMSRLNGGTPTPVDAKTLYPIAQSVGGGLLGTYYTGSLATGTQQSTQTTDAVDYLWTGANPPFAGQKMNEDFAATFDGQVMIPMSGDYTFTADTDGRVRIYVNNVLATDTSSAPPAPDSATCTHDICRPGGAVSRTCKQGGFCSAQICLNDPYCCSVTWDARCVQKIATVCGLNCSPTPPVTMTLSAGAKVQIRVEYEHIGKDANAGTESQGGKLSLMWAITGALRDVIPRSRLYAPISASGLGVGLNAAYFSDEAFNTEYLDRVDAVALTAGATPDASRATILCPTGGACTVNTPGAPTLASARFVQLNSDGTIQIELRGGGVEGTAAVTIQKVVRDATGAFVRRDPFDSFTGGATNTTGGTFTRLLNIPKGNYELQAMQTAGGLASGWSAALIFDADNPAAPPPPSVTVPPGGLLSGNGNITLSGTAAPNAVITVTSGNATYGPFNADAQGNWTTTLIQLAGAGGHDVTVTQTVNGVVSDVSQVTVKVALPSLSFLTPGPGDDTEVVGNLNIGTGSGADPSLGGVELADGDGQYFEQRATLPVSPNGTFSGGDVPLDAGRHVIKVYQQVGGVKGDGFMRSVIVRPSTADLVIDSPLPNTTIPATVTVTGHGAVPTGLPGRVSVFQGDTKIGEGPIDKYGNFSAAVTFAGAGLQPLSLKKTAYSLSGGGPADSLATDPIYVTVLPGAPKIDAPGTGTHDLRLSIPISGSQGVFVLEHPTLVTVTARQGTATVGTWQYPVGSSGTWGSLSGDETTYVPLPSAGSYVLTATQTIDGATSDPSVPVLVSLGDTTPPVIRFTDAATCSIDAPVLEIISQSTESNDGANVVFASKVCALDDSVQLQECATGQQTSCWSCAPGSGSFFPLGSTYVTCSAIDAVGNTKTARITVSVTNGGGPIISGQDATVEATGPDGALVNYQVAASGFVANCAPPGVDIFQPCTSWNPAYSGLGFAPSAAALYGGVLYAAFRDDNSTDGSRVALTSTNGGERWTNLGPLPPGGYVRQVLAGPGAPASLYIPSEGTNSTLDGLDVSHDGGLHWLHVLEGQPVWRVVADPNDPSHMFAWTFPEQDPSWLLFETHDEWATWSTADTSNLAGRYLLALAFDPLNPDRLYASMFASKSDLIQVKLYRKIGTGAWTLLSVPPHNCTGSNGTITSCAQSVSDIAVAPVIPPAPPNQSPQPFPTIIAGTVLSRDGGESWIVHRQGLFETVAFDPIDPNVIYASAGGGQLEVSQDNGVTWDAIQTTAPVSDQLIQDPGSPATFYSVYEGIGLFKSTNAGLRWSPLLAPGIKLPANDVLDMAFDPVSSNIAYLLSVSGGSFKTGDGGDSWALQRGAPGSVGELSDPFVSALATKIAVDRFDANNVYLGGDSGVWKSLDGGNYWTQLTSNAFLGLDTRTADTVYAGVNPTQVAVGANADGCVDELGNQCFARFDYQRLTNGNVIPDSLWLFNPRIGDGGHVFLTGNFVESIKLQFVPDANGSILMSFKHPDNANPGAVVTDAYLLGRANLSGFAATNGFGLPPLDGVQRPPMMGSSTLLQSSHVFYDASDGTNRLYLASNTRFIADPTQQGFGRTLIDGSEVDGWELLAPIANVVTPPTNASVPFTDFTRLLIDDASAGQVMYTIGVGNADGHFDSLWESRDGGRTWNQDTSTPPHLTNAWLSPLDGAIYATIAEQPDPNPTDFDNTADMENDIVRPGVLWKRTLVGGTPPGARVVLGAPRVTCAGPVGGTRAISSGSTFPVGETDLTCTATDAFGHPALPFTLHIMVQDTTPPILTVPADITVAAADATKPVPFSVTAWDLVDGDCMATPPSPQPTPRCRPVCDQTPNTVLPAGTTTVTCSSTDNHNNVSHATFRVSVPGGGTPPPIITIPNHGPYEATGPEGVTINSLGVTAQPTNVDLLCTPVQDGTTFVLGTTEVTCTATDPTTHAVTTGFVEVTVQDTTPPTLNAPTELDRTWDNRGLPLGVTASDTVDGTVTPTCTPASGTDFPLGTTTVTCRAQDRHGNATATSFPVKVAGLPPRLVLADQEHEAQDQTGARVPFDPPAQAFDAAGNPLLIDCVPGSGSWFPMGDTTVSCTSTDAGHESDGSFIVRVSDRQPPVLSVPADITVEAAGPDGTSVTFPVSAIDAVDGSCADGTTCKPRCQRVTNIAQPTDVTSPAVFPPGANGITCTSTDTAGNSVKKTFTINVRDTMAPVVHVHDMHEPADETGSALVATFGVSADDLVGGSLPVSCVPREGSRFLIGTTSVTCTARDAAGNEAQASFNLTVSSPGVPCTSTDACARTQTCVDGVCCTTACAGGTNDCQACSIAAGAPSDGVCAPIVAGRTCRASTGVCDIAETCDGARTDCPPDGFLLGTVCGTAPTCQQRICTGNSAICPGPTPIPGCHTDTTPPVIHGLPTSILAYATTATGANVSWPAPTAVDDVDGPVGVTCTPSSGSFFKLGPTTVKCTATDSSGNTTTPAPTFQVTVQFQAPGDGSFFAQPINPDGSSIFKCGSTIPVKFSLTGASAGITNLVAHISVARISNGVEGTYVETTSNAAPDGGSLFRYSGGQYIYNLSTKGMATGTWSIRADLGDGVNHSIIVSLR
jgi:hypothetical protein